MDLVNIPQNAEIQEIPLDWEDQVDVCFTIMHGIMDMNPF